MFRPLLLLPPPLFIFRPPAAPTPAGAAPSLPRPTLLRAMAMGLANWASAAAAGRHTAAPLLLLLALPQQLRS